MDDCGREAHHIVQIINATITIRTVLNIMEKRYVARSQLSIISFVWDYVLAKCKLFFAATPTHGFSYLMQDRPWAEHLYWSIVLLFITALSIFLIFAQCIQFNKSPTITIEQPKWLSVKEIAFPAIAVCTNNLISKHALKKYAEKMYVSIKMIENIATI